MRPRLWIPLTSGSHIVALGAGAVTNVFYARVLGVTEVGRLAIFYALAAAIVLLADSGLQLLLARALAQKSSSPHVALTVLVGFLPLLVLAWWAALYGGSIIGSLAWSSIALDGEEAVSLLELALTLWLFQVSLTLYQGLELYGRRSALIAGNGLLTAALTAGALTLSATFFAAIQATVLAYLVVALAGIVPVARRYSFGRITVRTLWSLVRAARALWLNSALTFGTTTASVLVAALVLPLASVGVYRVYKAIAAVFLAPLTTLLPPLYSHFSSLSPASRAEAFRLVRRGAVWILAAMIVASAPFLDWVVEMTFGPVFTNDLGILLALIVIGGIGFNYNLLGYVSTAAGNFRWPLVVNLVVTVIGFGVAPALALAFGFEGFVAAGALATVTGLAVAAALIGPLVGLRTVPLALWPPVVLSAAMLVAMWLITLPASTAVPIAIGVGLALIVAAVASVFNASLVSEIKQLGSVARAR